MKEISYKIENDGTIYCGYGCGQLAKFKVGLQEKFCCSESYRKCSSVRKLYGNPGSKNSMYGKHHTKESKKKNREKHEGKKTGNRHKSCKLENTENILCFYGCGNVAKYKLKNEKLCCSEIQNSCPIIKLKIGAGVKGKMVGFNHPMFNKTHTDEIKLSISIRMKGKKQAKLTFKRFSKRYPWFSEFEEIKEENGKILVRCKVCRTWFEPASYQIYWRAKTLQVKDKRYGHGFMYCSNICKKTCPQYYRKKDPEILSIYARYKQDVEKETYISFKLHKDKIPHSSLRSKTNNLDHKFSIFQGFKNKVHPKIISHWKNLEVIPELSNKSKRENCSISLKKLIKEIKSVELESFFKNIVKQKRVVSSKLELTTLLQKGDSTIENSKSKFCNKK